MLPETEQEIRIQFLETATEYLNNLESIFSKINAEPENIPVQINAALRILHSLKGNAGMLGFGMLSDLSHRLEDALQVLRGRRNQQDIDPDLHNLLLSAIDWLRHILELIATKSLIDEHWLATFCYPLFEELYKRLGQPDTENITSTITLTKTENIIHLLFKTEVEKSLQSLENLLQKNDPSLLLQVAMTTANELAGLGEMLDLPAFTQICQSIKQLLVTAKSEESIIQTTHISLQAWRRSQSLILTQNMRELPSVIHQYLDIKNSTFYHNYLEEINIPSQKILPMPAMAMEQIEPTIKIPIKQLEQLNDLCGELNIQRHSLQSHLVKLHDLTSNLSHNTKCFQQEQELLKNSAENIKNQIISDHEDKHHQLNLMSQTVTDTIVKFQRIITEIQSSLDNTDEVNYLLNNTAQKLQTSVRQVMMRPLSDLLDRFPKVLQDLSVEYGKNVQMKVEGANILIEPSILEALADPLMHLLRNAFDHGIETPDIRRSRGKTDQGLITIQASQQSDSLQDSFAYRIIIKVSDDGQGISLDKIHRRAVAMGWDNNIIASASDEELLSLIFEPGFSTCEEVTALSGRGVGMDVVCNNLKQVGGDIEVDTELGQRTTFTLLIPIASTLPLLQPTA